MYFLTTLAIINFPPYFTTLTIINFPPYLITAFLMPAQADETADLFGLLHASHKY